MKERTKRLQALFCALAVTATSVGSPLVSVPVYAEETQGAEDTSEHPETENGKATDTSDNAISESPDQVEKLIPENPNPEPVTEDEGDSSQKTTVAAEAAQTPQAATVQEATVQEAQIQEAETVTPKESTLTVKINGTAASGESLEAAVTASGTEAAAVNRLDLVSGTITQADLAYITTLTNLQNFHMQLGSGLKLIGKTGSATTVLGKNAAVLNFAPKASGSSKGALRSVELGGVTEILTGGIVSDSVEIVDLPDATEVGDDAFNGFGWLEKVSLPKAETVGMRAFYKCTRLTNVTLEAVKTLKKDSFYYTNSLKRLTLPATLETIEDIQFGRVGQGNKAGTRVVMKGMTPPTVASGAFTGVSQTTISTVTVPAGALDAYLAQINAENSSAGLISKRETMWNNLYLREEGSYAVEYYSEYITGVKVAYVKAGEGVTAEKVASATKAGNIFKGWNTKKNGTGEAFGEGSVPTDDITVYPVFAAACTIQVHQEDGTTTKLEVEKGQAIGENLPAAPEKEGYVFKEWNTSEDGTGETVTADTVITANMDIYPVYEENLPDVIKVLVNGISVDGSSLEDAIKDSKVAVADVTSIELVSGEITQNDLAYLAQITNLEKFTMHLGEDLILHGKDGNPTTVLGPNSAVLNFAPKAAGSSKGELREVHLEGVTEIQKGGIVSDSVEIVDLPDATEVGDDAFNGFGWLEKVSLPKAETIGMRAFYKCTRLTNVTLEAVKTLKKDSFYYTNSLKRLTLPATLETIENIQFGRVGQGNKAGTRVVMKGMTPPTVASGAFTGVSQTTISTVTVPAGALDAYLAQINAENSSAGLISKRETMWNNLYLREEGSYAVEYYSEYVTGVKVAYVKAGEGVTAEKVASATKAGNIFKGWNTKKNGTGEAFGEGSVPTDDITVYPVFAASCTVQIHQEDGTTTKLEVEKGQAIGENLPTAPEKEGYVFKEWNTSADGTGETVTADTVITANMDIYPVYEENQPDVIKVLVNGISVDGSSLEDAIKDSKVAVADVTSIELVSGEITQNDLAYLAQITNLEKFTMHLGEDLILHGKDGNPTTVLGPNSAVLNFAPKAAGSSKGELREVHLEGVTEIQKGGIVSDSVEIVDLPDATEVGDDAFNGFGWLEKVSLPKAETVGMRAFYKCTRLTDVTLEAVKTLKKDSFYYTNSLKRLTLPATLETIENIQFGRVGQGNKAGTRVVMKGMTPPTVVSGAFTGVSQTTISTVTVPAGALDAYLAQINAENSSAGLISKRETMWNNLYLREEGSYAVEYYSEYITGVKVAYVKAGEGVTAEKVASATKAGNIFKGWNTKKNGTGEAFGEGSVPTDDITVYPVFAAACTIQVHQEDGTTTKLEVEKGQAIGEKLPTAPEKEGYVFKEWNTSADGTGETVTADTVITANMDIYPVYEENQPDVIKVLVNGISVDGSSLEDAIKDSKVAVADVTSIELVSGEITQNDLAYLAQITNLEKFTMHLGEDLILHGKDGNPTTVLGPNSAVLNFAPKAAGSSKGELREVHLEGVTEIQKGGIVSDSVEIVDLPDATEVGDDAFNGFGWLEKVSLPKAETVGMRAFYKCTRLTDVTLEAVKTLKKDSFYYTNSLKRLTLPATLETIENIQFGRVGQGNKAGTRVVMKGMTPPTVASGAFTGVSQTTISTVTVPAGALDAYLAQINAENSSAGLISKRETMWNNLYLREEGSYAVEYYSEYVTGVKVAYVKAGEGVTAEKVASATKAGNIFKGWNTKKNGTGEAFGEGSVPTDDITVYPVFAAACTIQVHQEDGTTTKLEVEKGQAIGENLPAAPTKEGYLFKGWNTSADGTGETVTADTVITENMDLYPIFEEYIPPVVEVKVVFDVDGQKSERKVVKGEAIGSNLPADPEKDGYTFKGWNTKADGSGETVTAETVVTDEMEVYALFEQNPAPVEEVKVVIDVDGVKTEVKVIKGETIGSNLPSAPTKDGYTFKGWNTKADGTGETVTADTVVSDDLEVYAIFEKTEVPKDPEKPDPGKGDDTKKPETPTPTPTPTVSPTPTPTTTPTNTNTTQKNNTTTGNTTTPASQTTTTAQTAKTVKTADATPLASTAAAGGLSLLGMLAVLFGKRKNNLILNTPGV